MNIDLEDLLDACSECGALAGFETGKQDGDKVVRARCSECCNIGAWCYSTYDSTVQWNIEQRHLDPADAAVCEAMVDEVCNGIERLEG